MYLPQLLSENNSVGHHDECETSSSSRYACRFLLTRLISSIKATWVTSRSPPDLRRRDDLQTQNITIGVVVGIFLTIFLVALFYFLHRYSASIRVRKKRRSRRRGSRAGSGSSKGSASSTSTQGSAPPAPEPATA
ncbi:hypothetical protein QBC37DRAFT_371939 [Rhypophila decipiens]|uniref:Uncharacterized protein n=1 Tax=Rhypophila decipiens TaxID=261697 RepID=A0AAN6YG25_9PEZI|nr:hypothetical protein QBC37DRAFT_371939 [Rhypophila decipiens]